MSIYQEANKNLTTGRIGGFTGVLDARCKNDVSDEECNKCMKHKYILQCPENCPDYEDWREDGVQKADRHDKKLSG
jgi:hypothetical protein